MNRTLVIWLSLWAMYMMPPALCLASSKVVVIPLGVRSSLQNVVTVARSGGDFTSPLSALASINDAGVTKPYVIYIAPGVYDMGAQSLVMKANVSIVGAGQGVSVLKWKQSGSSMTTGTCIRGADKAHLANLTIEQVAGDAYGIGVLNDGSSPIISNIEIIQTSFATSTIGIFNTSSAAPEISSTTITVHGITGFNYGVFNSAASPSMNDVKVTVRFGPFINVAIRNDASSAVMNNIRALASSSVPGAMVVGLQCLSSGQPIITNSSFQASGGATVYGLEIQAGSSGARIINSRIVGGVRDDAAGTQCRDLYDANLLSINC